MHLQPQVDSRFPSRRYVGFVLWPGPHIERWLRPASSVPRQRPPDTAAIAALQAGANPQENSRLIHRMPKSP